MLLISLAKTQMPAIPETHSPQIAGQGSKSGNPVILILALLLAFGVSQLVWGHNLWALMVLFWLCMIGHGAHQSCSQSGAVGPFPQAAGAASALNGFLMMLAAFFMGHWLGNHLDGTVYPLAFGIWFWSIVVALSAWTVVQKYGQSAAN
jgi:hypothetical protein